MCVQVGSEEEDDEEESHFSEGQLVPAGSQSDDSDVSEEMIQGEEVLINSDMMLLLLF